MTKIKPFAWLLLGLVMWTNSAASSIAHWVTTNTPTITSWLSVIGVFIGIYINYKAALHIEKTKKDKIEHDKERLKLDREQLAFDRY